MEGLGTPVWGCSWEPVEVANLIEIEICEKLKFNLNVSPWNSLNRVYNFRFWEFSDHVGRSWSAGRGVGWQGASHFQLGRRGWLCWTLLSYAAQNVLPTPCHREGNWIDLDIAKCFPRLKAIFHPLLIKMEPSGSLTRASLSGNSWHTVTSCILETLSFSGGTSR